MALKEKFHASMRSHISAIETAARHVEENLGADDNMEKASKSFAELKGAVEKLGNEVDDLASAK